jgi:hypothetical protein
MNTDLTDFTLEQRLEAEQQRILNDYYNSLTAEQQKVIDQRAQAALSNLSNMFGIAKPDDGNPDFR